MRIGVTGLGFIGSTLVNELLSPDWPEPFEVIGMDNRFKENLDNIIPFVINPRFEFMVGDVSNIQDVQKFYAKKLDLVVHTAGLVGFPICDRFKDLAYSTNVKGCENITKYKPDGTKLIYTSTGSVYSPGQNICTELSQVDPPSWYGKTKLMGEEAVLWNKESIVHRYGTACGVGFSTLRVNLLLNDLVYKAMTDRSITIFEADFKRVFINIADLVEAIITTIFRFDKLINDENRIYNIANNNLTLSKRELANMISEKTGCHLVFADIMKDKDKRDYGYSSDKFMNKTGWQPQISLEKTIDDLIKVVPLLTPWNRYN